MRNTSYSTYIVFGSILIFISSAFMGTKNNNFNQDDKWLAPQSTKKLKNPIPNDKYSIKRGKAIYKMRCVICHGEKGKGDGLGSKALNPKPADHTSASTQTQTDGELFWKISEGRGAMVGWKLVMKDENERWDLVNFIRTLKE